MILSGCEEIKSGTSICIFPEGTRGKTESELELGEFHNGSFKMATKTGCPIIPLSISGSREILEAHFPKIRGTHVTVTYGKPIIPGELTKEEKKEIGNYTKNILLEQLKENDLKMPDPCDIINIIKRKTPNSKVECSREKG